MVTPAAAPGFTKVFNPDQIAQGAETTLTFTIDNAANSILAGNLAFTDDFPAGLLVADAPAVANDCGGTFTANAGDTSIGLADGEVAAGATCDITVTVRAIGSGTLTNTTSELTSTIATASEATDDLVVTPAAAPGFTKVFNPDQIAQGAETTLTFTIDNAANSILVGTWPSPMTSPPGCWWRMRLPWQMIAAALSRPMPGIPASAWPMAKWPRVRRVTSPSPCAPSAAAR